MRMKNDCWVNEMVIAVATVVQRGVTDLTVKVALVQTAVDALWCRQLLMLFGADNY